MNSRPEGAILVTTPQDVAMATIRKEINFCSKMNLNIIGIVENMSTFVCPCCQVRYTVTGCGQVQVRQNDQSLMNIVGWNKFGGLYLPP